MVRALGAHGHERRFKRKPRTSASPLIPDIIAASHRLASYQFDPRRGAADRRQHCQAAPPFACPFMALLRDFSGLRPALIRTNGRARRPIPSSRLVRHLNAQGPDSLKACVRLRTAGRHIAPPARGRSRADNRTTIDAGSALDCWTGRQGCRGGVPPCQA